MKSGANQRDVVIMQRMYGEGISAAEISQDLGIDIKCVENFAPKNNPLAVKAEPVSDEAVEEVTAEKTNPLKPKSKK